MKTTKITALALGALLLIAGCKESPKSDEATVTEAKEVAVAEQAATDLPVDTTASTLAWVGSKVVGDRHTGTLDITNGKVSVKDSTIVAGSFTIDMNSLTITDEGMDAESKGKLSGHLKNADFFEVDKYPTAKFEVTEVKPYTATDATAAKPAAKDKEFSIENPTHFITGNLTMRDTTVSITFPAKVAISGNEVTTDAKFNVDRTKFGANYGSEANLGNKMIKPEVNISLHVVAKK